MSDQIDRLQELIERLQDLIDQQEVVLAEALKQLRTASLVSRGAPLRANQAAEFLGISRRTFQNYAPFMPRIELGKNGSTNPLYGYFPHDLIAWANGRRVEPDISKPSPTVMAQRILADADSSSR